MRIRLLFAVLALAAALADAALADVAAPRVECGQPRLLHLQRFEDGSARLWCGQRLLLRIGVPW